MEIRSLCKDDLPAVMEIYGSSRKFMAENGNAGQWGEDYPSKELVESFIGKGGYAVMENGEITGVFILSDKEDSYKSIDGQWLDDNPYGVIHMIASGGARKGAGQFILDWCLEKTGNIRIDTHINNIPMRRLLEKNNYIYCGIISLGVRGERIAFQKVDTGVYVKRATG